MTRSRSVWPRSIATHVNGHCRRYVSSSAPRKTRRSES